MRGSTDRRSLSSVSWASHTAPPTGVTCPERHTWETSRRRRSDAGGDQIWLFSTWGEQQLHSELLPDNQVSHPVSWGGGPGGSSFRSCPKLKTIGEGRNLDRVLIEDLYHEEPPTNPPVLPSWSTRTRRPSRPLDLVKALLEVGVRTPSDRCSQQTLTKYLGPTAHLIPPHEQEASLGLGQLRTETQHRGRTETK